MAGGQTASPLTYAARFAGGTGRSTMTLRPVGDGTGLCYLPMYPAGVQYAEFEGDVYARLDGEEAQVAFVTQPGSGAPVALQKEEQAYAAAVREGIYAPAGRHAQRPAGAGRADGARPMRRTRRPSLLKEPGARGSRG